MRDGARLDDRLQAGDEAGAYQRIELITGRRVRRRWSADEKAQIIAESATPGADRATVLPAGRIATPSIAPGSGSNS